MRTNIYSHISTHIYNSSILPIQLPLVKIPPQITPQHNRRNVSTTFLHQTAHSMHRKYNLPPLNLYIYPHAPPQPVDIILAMFL